MITNLNSLAISELATESSVHNLLNEWLGLWFDGGTHAVGNAVPIAFPRAAFKFGQSEAEQPMGGENPAKLNAEIRLVMLPRDEEALPQVDILASGKHVWSRVVLQFWVSAKKIGRGQGQYLARSIAELLKAILSNPDARYALALKGIMNFQPRPPMPVPSTDYDTYMVACGVELQYAIQFDMGLNGQAVTPVTGALQPLTFVRDEVCVVGEKLTGAYAMSATVTATQAYANAWASQGTPTALALYVNNVATGITLTLAAGAANTDVSAVANFTLVIPQGQAIQWKIQSGAADAQHAAWRVSVVLNVVGS